MALAIEGPSQVRRDKRGTIQVNHMRWTDPKNGQSGTYSGKVNDRIVPHGKGAMEYDPHPNNDMSGMGVSVVLVKDGKWKDGRFGRQRWHPHSCSRRTSSIDDSKRSICSFSTDGSDGGGDKSMSLSSRSRVKVQVPVVTVPV